MKEQSTIKITSDSGFIEQFLVFSMGDASDIVLFHQSRQKNNKSHPKDRPSNANNQSHLFWQ